MVVHGDVAHAPRRENTPGLGPQSLSIRTVTVIDFFDADSRHRWQRRHPHERITGDGPGTTYIVTVNPSGTWYCHIHGTPASRAP